MFLGYGCYMDEQATSHESGLPYYYMWLILVRCPTKANVGSFKRPL